MLRCPFTFQPLESSVACTSLFMCGRALPPGWSSHYQIQRIKCQLIDQKLALIASRFSWVSSSISSVLKLTLCIQDKFTIFYMWFILHLLYILQTTKTLRSLLEGNQENLDIRDKKKEAIGEEIAGQASHQIVTQGDILVKRQQPL